MRDYRGAVFVDLDNTLYDWTAFFSQSFDAMAEAVSVYMTVEKALIVEQFRDVYANHGSLEYSAAIQELEVTRLLSTDKRESLIRIGHDAFSKVRRSLLRPYDGVEMTLRWLRSQYMAVCGVTSAGMFDAQFRLYELGLDRYMDSLAAWEGVARDRYSALADGFVPNGRLRSKTRIPVHNLWTLSDSEMKPSTFAFETTLDALGLDPRDCYAVGDSPMKDLLPAKSLGMTTVWARYGQDIKRDDYNIILQIVPWSGGEVDRHYSHTFEPDVSIENFAELRRVVPRYQLSLFDI